MPVNDLTTAYRIVQERSIPGGEQCCLLWQGSKTGRGYGNMKCEGVNQQVHRVVWMFHHGAISADMNVLHSCDTPNCVEIDHLRLGTNDENHAEKARKGRGAKKLTIEAVIELRRMADAGVTQQELSQLFGVNCSIVSRIISGKRWGHVPLGGV